MKKYLYYVLLCFASMSFLNACESAMPENPEQTTPPVTPQDSSIIDDFITIDEAIAIAKQLPDDRGISDKRYRIKGWVVGFDRNASFYEQFPKYGNDNVILRATKDTLSYTNDDTFLAYRLLGKFGAKLPDLECIQVGDYIVISCYICNFRGRWESTGATFVYNSDNSHFNEIYPIFPSFPVPHEGEYSVSEAETIALNPTQTHLIGTTEMYAVRGVVVSIEDTTNISKYGNVKFNISDGITYAQCRYLYAKEPNGRFDNGNQIAIGDTVLVIAEIQSYNNICELSNGYIAESTNKNF